MTRPRVLVVGAGGLSCPATDVLARSGIAVTVVDDDVVDASNLHRQTLFTERDVGASKAEAAARRARELGADARAVRDRLLPENALELLRGHALVLEGADNYATKFLAFDAARLAHVPIVQAGAVRLRGWALASAPSPDEGRPSACFRCVFEDVPAPGSDSCDVAGVLGPVVGLMGALEAALALRILLGRAPFGELHTYDARAFGLRRAKLRPRRGCPSCAGSISDLRRDRYAPSCAA